MPPTSEPTFRQQRAIEAIQRAATDLDIAIRIHAPEGEAARQARRSLEALLASLRQAILRPDA